MNHKIYTINGKRVIHRPLSPMQLIRIAAVVSELQEFIKDAGKELAHIGEGVTVDMNIIYEILTHLESRRPEIITRLLNAVFIDAETGRPCYLTDKLLIEDFYAIDPPTFLEVVADFFTLNDVSKTSSLILALISKVTSLNALPNPSAASVPEGQTKANANG